jgi:hypothetical protein
LKNPGLKALVVLALVDLAALAVGAFIFWRTPPRQPVFSVPPRDRLGETNGRVVKEVWARCGPPSRPSTCTRAVVEFVAGGATYSLTGRHLYHAPAPFRVGDPQPVLFRPEAPGNAWLRNEYEFILESEKPRGLSPRGTVLAVGLSVALPTTLGILFLMVARHQARQANGESPSTATQGKKKDKTGR